MWRPLLLLSLVCTCVPLPFDRDGNCGPASDFVPGTYVSTGGKWVNGRGQYPHAEAGGKTLVLQRQPDDKARLLISYARGGKAIVETWQDDGTHGAVRWAPGFQSPAVLTLTPAEFDFRAVEVGGTAIAQFTVRNAGGRVSSQLVSTGMGEGFVFNPPSCGGIPAGGSCLVVVAFRPMTTGTFAGVLSVNTGPGTAVLTAAVTGVGVARDASPAAPDAPPDLAGDAGPGDDAVSAEDVAGDTAGGD
jgi:hypothetical protein